MADVLTGVTEIAAVSQTEISRVAQAYLQQESLLLGTVTDYSAMAGQGVKAIDIPRAGGFTVASKAENTAAEAQTSAWSTDTISLNNHRVVQFLIEDIASQQAKVALAQEYIMRASKDLARDADQHIIAQLKLASASAPDHQINFIDTTNDVIAKGDILATRALMQAQFINPRECFIGIGPEKENELLAISEFISAETYGSANLLNGEIGKIYGMPVIVHVDFEDFMCTWHKSAVGFAMQKGLNFDQAKDLPNLGTRYSLDMLHGVKVLDSGKRNVLTDSTN